MRNGVNEILYRNAIELMFFGYFRSMQSNGKDSISNGGAGVTMASTFQSFRRDFNIDYDQFSDNKGYKLVEKMTKEFKLYKKNQNGY